MASIIRLGARRAAPSLSRSFSVSAASRKDIIQDLYIGQLKSYKPAPQAKDAHTGLVRNYTAPKPPKPPALPTDLAGELSKFDAEEPVIGSTTTSTAAPTEGGESAEEFLTFLEQDLPKDEAHH
ncbi:ATP synthase complex subunit H-domain-containing protein [Naematelia encephala]|uniref:ATP synthase complex subunit H-domain-containing protein n=1 Tax=Naematelia encephala TaxID=71784 RepID=A0A1Y2ADW5_9TREE|nr:ATP synthase complex subunit H-domain-containing protein [Naematelia encephala]